MMRNVIVIAVLGLMAGVVQAAWAAEAVNGGAKFAVYGGTDGGPALHRAVAEAIAAQGPDFVIHTGDMNEPRLPGQTEWQPGFAAAAKPITARCKIYPVLGTAQMDDAQFSLLHDAPDNRFYYSFDSGPVHVAVLDSQAAGPQRQAMLDWLDKDLSAAHAAWTVVACHEPFFTVDGRIGRWGLDDALPILQKNGVDVVVSGRAHVYERFVPIGPAGSKPIIHVVTAGGGVGEVAPPRSPMLAAGYGYSGPHFCLFEVKGNQLDLTMRRPDGSVLDRMTLVKTDGAYQKEVMAAAVEPARANVLAPLFADFDADFPQFPEPGKPVKIILDGRRFPAGSQVTIAAAAQSAGGRGTGGRGTGGPPRVWTVPAQKLPAADRMTLEATAPPGLTAMPEGFDPLLWLSVSVEVGGQTYTADQVQVPLTQAIAARRFPEPAPVPVPYSARAITVDGDASDWDGITPTPCPFKAGAPGSVRLCWREDGLYGVAVVTDDSIDQKATQPWAGDGLELFIDRDFSRALMKTKTAIEIGLSPAPQMGPGRAHVTVPYGGVRRTADQPAEIACVWRPTERGYVLEFCLPAQVMAPARLASGTKLGLNFMVDNDARHAECFYSDNSVMDGWRTPVTWGAIVLAK